MPREQVERYTTDGDIIRLELRRVASGALAVVIEVMEVDRKNDLPEASRMRVFHTDELTPELQKALLTEFDRVEDLLRRRFYS